MIDRARLVLRQEVRCVDHALGVVEQVERLAPVAIAAVRFQAALQVGVHPLMGAWNGRPAGAQKRAIGQSEFLDEARFPKTMGKEMGKVAVLRIGPRCFLGWKLLKKLAPQVGFEPTTLRLTGDSS